MCVGGCECADACLRDCDCCYFIPIIAIDRQFDSIVISISYPSTALNTANSIYSQFIDPDKRFPIQNFVLADICCVLQSIGSDARGGLWNPDAFDVNATQ